MVAASVSEVSRAVRRGARSGLGLETVESIEKMHAPHYTRAYRLRLFSHHYFTFSSILRSPGLSRPVRRRSSELRFSRRRSRPPRDLAGSPLGGPSRHRRAPRPRASVRSPRLPSAEHSLSPSPHATHRPPRPQALAAKSSGGPNGTERDRRRPVPSPAPRRKRGVSMP